MPRIAGEDALDEAAAVFGRFVGLPVELQVMDTGASGS